MRESWGGGCLLVCLPLSEKRELGRQCKAEAECSANLFFDAY